MSEFFFPYMLGLFVTMNLLGIWFESTIFLYLFSKFANKEIYTFDELIDIVETKSNYLADLLSCVWCLGAWVSLVVASFISFFITVDDPSQYLLFVLACIFSWPSLCKKVFKIGDD